jgi:hypothetical protein
MTVRLDIKHGMIADMRTWFYESTDPVYKKIDPIHPKIVDPIPDDEIQGGYWKATSAIGARELQDRIAGGKLYEDRPADGYPVYGVVKDKNLMVQAPLELERDFPRIANWLKDYVQKNWPAAVETTKDKLITDLINYGGYTSGHSVFNNNSTDLNLTTYSSPDLTYDGKPWFALTGNNHTAKDAQTYFNAHALAGIDYANALTMYKRMVASNGYMENGRPFDNGMDLKVMCARGLGPDWQIVNNSTLIPDDANNAVNPLKGMFKDITENPFITTSTFSMIYRKGAVRAWFGKVRFNFWEEENPPGFWASVILPYVRCIQNFRLADANNAPTSA